MVESREKSVRSKILGAKIDFYFLIEKFENKTE